MKRSVVTKTGDKGMTSTIRKHNNRVWKDDEIIQLVGDLDEVNAGIGYLRSLFSKNEFIAEEDSNRDLLQVIQYELYRISTEVSSFFELKSDVGCMKELEESIDLLEEKLPELKNFVQYSGSELATWAFYVRAVVRRAERSFVTLLIRDQFIKDTITYSKSYTFINRLSDYLFLLGRYFNYTLGYSDEKQVKKEN